MFCDYSTFWTDSFTIFTVLNTFYIYIYDYVKGIIVPKSGHATAYVERFVCVILRRLGPFALRTGKKTLRLVYIPFGVRFMCIVYIAYMATVVLIVKISFIRLFLARCVYAYCLHFTYI